MNRSTSPVCPAFKRSEETVHHYLSRCPAYNTQRGRVERKLKRGVKDMKMLLNKPKAIHIYSGTYTAPDPRNPTEILHYQRKRKGRKRDKGK
jgi:hypothetical protein